MCQCSGPLYLLCDAHILFTAYVDLTPGTRNSAPDLTHILAAPRICDDTERTRPGFLIALRGDGANLRAGLHECVPEVSLPFP
jgi:hypothetical protein